MPERPLDPAEMRRLAEEVLAHPDYDLRPRPSAGDRPENPFLKWLREEILEPIQGFFAWIFGGLDWLGWIGLGAILALVAYAVWGWYRSRMPLVLPPPTAPAHEGSLPPDALIAAANTAAQRGDYPEAARLLMRACVLKLEAAEKRVNRPGTTNREVLRRYRSSSIYDDVRCLVDTVDQSWFGERPCDRTRFAEVQSAFDRITGHTRERRPRSEATV
jgi:hypothetical protein